MSAKQTLCFWNGNKSLARQRYELALLQACLASSEPALVVEVDTTDYPRAEDEADVFSRGIDILVTVAGNKKFANRRKIAIHTPLAKGLLGYRLLIVRDEMLPAFKLINSAAQLRELALGIPLTWADADLFRHNGYNVVERGTFDSLFERLRQGEFDYVALGANEIEAVFEQHAAALGGLCMEPSMLLYYPFPLVFYVHAEQPALARRIEVGLASMMRNGEFDALFSQYHGDVVQRLQLLQRQRIVLHNPLLPDAMAGFESTLLD
ncbi:MAG: transporter substrate-binding domain-containing protein [Gammaproteobacteria bacterium]|nr:transporter substrate-binding domain-containing protein [Gammaproteobacteria bacterium]